MCVWAHASHIEVAKDRGGESCSLQGGYCDQYRHSRPYLTSFNSWVLQACRWAPHCALKGACSWGVKGPLTYKIFIAEKGRVLLVEKLRGTQSCKQWLQREKFKDLVTSYFVISDVIKTGVLPVRCDVTSGTEVDNWRLKIVFPAMILHATSVIWMRPMVLTVQVRNATMVVQMHWKWSLTSLNQLPCTQLCGW